MAKAGGVISTLMLPRTRLLVLELDMFAVVFGPIYAFTGSHIRPRSGVDPKQERLAAPAKEVPMKFSLAAVFRRSDRYEGVRPINIFLLRLLYVLMFFVLGRETWTRILTHEGAWEPNEAVVWCVWNAFATLAVLGIFRPLKMLPIVFLEIFYKLQWLIIVAYPLWSNGTLTGSPAEQTTVAFLWVILPIVAVPWGYAVKTYVFDFRASSARQN
jgi:hypothetical protein